MNPILSSSLQNMAPTFFTETKREDLIQKITTFFQEKKVQERLQASVIQRSLEGKRIERFTEILTSPQDLQHTKAKAVFSFLESCSASNTALKTSQQKNKKSEGKKKGIYQFQKRGLAIFDEPIPFSPPPLMEPSLFETISKEVEALLSDPSKREIFLKTLYQYKPSRITRSIKEKAKTTFTSPHLIHFLKNILLEKDPIYFRNAVAIWVFLNHLEEKIEHILKRVDSYLPGFFSYNSLLQTIRDFKEKGFASFPLDKQKPIEWTEELKHPLQQRSLRRNEQKEKSSSSPKSSILGKRKEELEAFPSKKIQVLDSSIEEKIEEINFFK